MTSRRSSSGGSSRSCPGSAGSSATGSRRSWPPPGAGEFAIQPDGSVDLAGLTLAPDEVEILATPRPGTAVAHDEGLVVVIDTELTPELRAEGDARELQRAIQDLRREAELALDDRIEVWVDPLPDVDRRPPRDASPPRRSPTRSTPVRRRPDLPGSPVELDAGTVRIALRRVGGDG